MYTAYGLLTKSSDFTLESAVDKLQKKFPNASVALEGGVINLSGSDWDFHLQLNAGDLAAEHEELAIKLGGVENNPEVAASTKRVEVWSDTNDPFLEHFNDFLQVIEVLQTYRGLIAIDPKEPAFM
jgi:hypothetical protein